MTPARKDAYVKSSEKTKKTLPLLLLLIKNTLPVILWADSAYCMRKFMKIFSTE